MVCVCVKASSILLERPESEHCSMCVCVCWLCCVLAVFPSIVRLELALLTRGFSGEEQERRNHQNVEMLRTTKKPALGLGFRQADGKDQESARHLH